MCQMDFILNILESAELLGFSHTHKKNSLKRKQTKKLIQWAATVLWVEMPCWRERSEVNSQTSSSLQKSMGPQKASQNAHVKPWGTWATTSEDLTGSWSLSRTGIWDKYCRIIFPKWLAPTNIKKLVWKLSFSYWTTSVWSITWPDPLTSNYIHLFPITG